MFNFKKGGKTTVILEGCLSEEKAVICSHGNHEDSCYLCEQERKKDNEKNRSTFFSLGDSLGDSLGRISNLDE